MQALPPKELSSAAAAVDAINVLFRGIINRLEHAQSDFRRGTIWYAVISPRRGDRLHSERSDCEKKSTPLNVSPSDDFPPVGEKKTIWDKITKNPYMHFLHVSIRGGRSKSPQCFDRASCNVCHV